MNAQDPVGRAAMANEARQKGDDSDWDDDDGTQSEGVVNVESEDDRSHWGTYRDEPKRTEAWRDFNPFEYGWTIVKAKSKK